MASSRSTAGNRLGLDDWIQVGYALLVEEGIKALEIDRLCEEDRRVFDDMGDRAPGERLSQMMSSLVSPRHWTLERAMREWARSDDAVAESVRAADRRLLRAVRPCCPEPTSPKTCGTPTGCWRPAPMTWWSPMRWPAPNA